MPLALLYTQIFSVAYIPTEWTKAIITPVFKKGTTGNIENYHPISLTSVLSKLMERIIARSLLDHLKDNALLSTEQHGFIPGRSTCTNLLEAFNDWTLNVQNKHGIAVANIDFSKAFDCVSHDKLLA